MKPVRFLPGNMNTGTMMIEEGLHLPTLGMETVAYSRQWRSVTTLDSSSLGRTLDAAGWHLFFVAGQVTALAFGLAREKSLHKAVDRIAAQVGELNLNCLELTEIRRKHFLGVPYIAISARSYHIQQGWQLQNVEQRRKNLEQSDRPTSSRKV